MNLISLEMIDYQVNDSFPTKLDEIVESIYDGIYKGKFNKCADIANKSDNIKKLEKEIKDRLGLNVVYDEIMSDRMLGAIIPFEMDAIVSNRSIFNRISKMGKFFKELLSRDPVLKRINTILSEKKTTQNKLNNAEGWINLKQAKVGGYLAEVKHHLIINFFQMVELELSPQEATSIILHELGHAFTGLEHHHRLSTTNMTILDIIEDINKNKSKEDIVYKYKRFFNDSDIEKAKHGNDKETTNFSDALASSYVKNIDSQLLIQKYDQTSFENMADNFAVRFGYGKHLATALARRDLLYHSIGTEDEANAYYIGNMVGVFLIVAIMSSISSLSIAMFGILTLVKMFRSPSSAGYTAYDTPLDRLNRVKNGMINSLKNTNLPDDVVRDTVEEIELIISLMKDKKEFVGVLDQITGLLNTKERDIKLDLERQKNIENILNNELFLKSAKIKVS